METALRAVMSHMMDDYVSGLDKADMSQFPVTMRNLTLKPKPINQELEDVPFNLDEGRIGMLVVTPGWMGNVEVQASGINIKLSFDARKAARLAMQPGEPGSPQASLHANRDLFLTNQPMPPQPPPAPVPPRFCPDHDSSDKRKKREQHDVSCLKCGVTYQTTYDGALLCPPCSDKEKKCLICGKAADTASTYIPAMTCQPVKESMRVGGPNGNTRTGSMQQNGSVMQSASMNMNTKLPPGMQQTPSMQQRDMRGMGPTPSFPLQNQGQSGLPPPPPGNNMGQMQGMRGPAPGPMPTATGRPPMTRDRRASPPEEDEESFFDFIKNLTCNAVGVSEDDDFEASPRRHRR